MTPEEADARSPHPTEIKELCSVCVREKFLQKMMGEAGGDGQCSYCGDRGKTLSIAEVSIIVREAFQEYCFRTDHLKDLGNRRGDRIVDVIAALAQVEIAVAEDVRCVLADWSQTEGTDGGVLEENPFCPSARYERANQVDDGDLHSNWHWDFKWGLKNRARYFNRDAEASLHNVFAGIEKLRSTSGDSVIVTAGPGTAISALYRARVFQSVRESQFGDALKHPETGIGPPPLRPAGRMNASGISVFYGALEEVTAVAEVRPVVGSQVVVGRFDLIRQMRLLDLRSLKSIEIDKGSVFDIEHTRLRQRAQFFAWLVDHMSRPIMPDDKVDEYLETQVIADFLANAMNPPLDGVMFRSSQVRGKGVNVVLFQRATRVRPINVPKGTTVSVESSRGTHLGNVAPMINSPRRLEKGPDIEYTVWDEVSRKPAGWTSSDFYSGPESDRYDLKLDLGSLEVRFVEEIEYITTNGRVSRYRRAKGKQGRRRAEPS